MELNAENLKNEIQSLIKALKDCGGWVKRGNGEGWFNQLIKKYPTEEKLLQYWQDNFSGWKGE